MRLFRYSLNDLEQSYVLRFDYGAGSTSGNHCIGRTLISVLEEGVSVPEGRETFAAQRIKDIVIKRLASKKLGPKTRAAVNSNYGHYIIKNRVEWIIYCRSNGWNIFSTIPWKED